MRTTFVGLGGGLATITIEQFNHVVAAVIGVLTVIHLVFKIIEAVRRYKDKKVE